MKQNYKFTIRYDGTKYQGWEHQPGRDTIQGKIESVLTRMIETEHGDDYFKNVKRGIDDTLINLIAAGRTDAGVHAKAMIANAIIDTEYSDEKICSYMNHYLPEDISIDGVKKCADHFHSRYNAKGKTYIYTCWCGDIKPVFNRKYVTVIDRMPDIKKMKEAAQDLTGMHDYKSFCGNSHFKKSSVRVVDKIEITKEGPVIRFIYHGNGFLQNMVRIMTGTLLEVGYGKKAPCDIKEIIDVRSRTAAGFTAPPEGLCLDSIDYD